MCFKKAHAFTAKWEGGLSDDVHDAGGLTKYGVSIEFLKAVYAESVPNRTILKDLNISVPITRHSIYTLTRTQAEELFRWQFWDRLKLDRFPCAVSFVLYDTAVNCGRGTAVKLGQRGCNAGGYRPMLDVDSMLGPRTAAAFKVAEPYVSSIIDARDDYYRAIVKNKPTQQVFLKGWLNRTKDLRSCVKEV